MSIIKEIEFDVLVVGAGGGGCSCAIEASRKGVSVGLISKEEISIGNTRLCEAAVACSGVMEGDSPEVFIDDIMKGGEYLNHLELVCLLAKNASSAINFLEEIGHSFRRDDKGKMSKDAVNRLGGHSYARTFYSSGSGISLSHALRNAVANTDKISIIENIIAFSLINEDDEIKGIFGVELKTSDPYIIKAKKTVLATGGCGWLYYPQTTNNRSATGEGFSMAFEAGANLIDMEMIQFFPFAMNHPARYAGSLLEEPILAGPKGKLINGLGDVVADHDIDRMTRAEVTALMAREINEGRDTDWGGLKLDLSGNLKVPEMIEYKRLMDKRRRFEKVRRAYGEKAFEWQEPWDVSPSAHYTMGGVKIDSCAKTNLKNLFAIGEVAGGVMGANRLGSTSIADVIVMGRIVGVKAAEDGYGSDKIKISRGKVQYERGKYEKLILSKGRIRPIKIKSRLHKIMIENAGIARNEKTLTKALSDIGKMEDELENDCYISGIKRYNTDLVDAIELKHMLSCARMIAFSARQRRESRGAHLRLDFPKKDNQNWLKNVIINKSGKDIKATVSDTNYCRLNDRSWNGK